MTLRPASVLIPVQGLVALFILISWPPTSGKLMLLSLSGGDRNSLAMIAFAAHSRLLGAGPLPGSMVVVGKRSAVSSHGGWSVLVTAAPPAGCGDTIDHTSI